MTVLDVARQISTRPRRTPLVARLPVRPVLAAGHALALVAVFLPWLAGGFGARGALSGIDLARVTWSGAAGLPLGGAGEVVATAALYGVAALALDGLVLLAVGPRLGLSTALVERVAVALAVPVVIVTLAVLGLALGVFASDRVDGAAWGLAVLMTAAVLAGTAALAMIDREAAS